MAKANSLLKSGHNVSETAEALGFEYPQHFSRMFKKEFGKAPNQIIRDDK